MIIKNRMSGLINVKVFLCGLLCYEILNSPSPLGARHAGGVFVSLTVLKTDLGTSSMAFGPQISRLDYCKIVMDFNEIGKLNFESY